MVLLPRLLLDGDGGILDNMCYLGGRGSIKGSKVGFKIFFLLLFLNGKMCGILE